MKPWLELDGVTVYHGDCIEVMRALPEASVHAIVTDPPYGLEFMGKDWDAFSPVDLDRGGRWTKENRAGAGRVEDEKDKPHGRIAYGANRTFTNQCQSCGKRDAFRNPHKCGEEADWRRVVVDQGPPPQMVAFGE